ncbi:hypothetical protein [Methylorubrum rhodesianum]|uniref:hypothetical protein n=1 Tax=Methylorubrum rhodesianum TaxID=29427 RepID=UPI0037469EBE
MKTIWVGAALVVLLSACNAAKTPGRAELLMSDEEVAAKDDAICKSYGAQPGTPVYIQCRATQDQRRDAYKAERRRG